MFTRLSKLDPSSYSNPECMKIKHMDLVWQLDFDKKIISGSSTLHIEVINSSLGNELILDTKDLCVLSVTNEKSDILEFSLAEPIKDIGSKLTVFLPVDMMKQPSFKLLMKYECSQNASGLQWLDPVHTETKNRPFMFSQFQSIGARSVLPCQDTPGVKFSYTAEVNSKSDVTIIMGAPKREKLECAEGVCYKFSQPIPIPAYLIAIVAGELFSASIGPRSTVFAEKGVIDAAAFEFEDVEKMIQAAESICGKYLWETYDMVVLPNTFPYGGMENPNLTFLTPTLLAGDKSLVTVLAHEISHSWTGNLITNENWEHFWLNEGFTRFVERKIDQVLYSRKERHLKAYDGWKILEDTVKNKGETSPCTCLVSDLTGVDPEENYTPIPYEKGHAFLWHLESVVGEERMNKFLKSYLEKFAPNAINTTQFKNYFYEFFSDMKSALDNVDWNGWLHKPGMPPVTNDYDTSLIEQISKMAKKIDEWDLESPFPVTEEIKNISVAQKILWLRMLLDYNMSIKKVERLDSAINISSSTNYDIRFIWLKIGIKARWPKAIELALSFVNSTGRMKFTVPIYSYLYNWEETREKVLENFNEHKGLMMDCAANKIKKELHL